MTRRIVTVFADASFHPPSSAAGYAIWIKVDGQTIRHAGAFRAPQPHPTVAELGAIANGICVALERLSMGKGDLIVAATDCLRAIDIIEGKARTNRLWPQAVEIRDHVRARIAERGVELRLKHVGGHKGNVTPRNAVNEWCDRAAKEAMRTVRDAPRETPAA